MHNNEILHRDLKLENIVLAELNNLSSAKLCDFGFSVFTTHSMNYEPENKSNLCGTPFYMAPELFSVKPLQSKSADV